MAALRYFTRLTSNTFNNGLKNVSLSSTRSNICNFHCQSVMISRPLSVSTLSQKALFSSKEHIFHSKHHCSCKCGIHTSGDKELVEFLVEEIAEEEKMKNKQSLTEIAGFKVEADGGNLSLKKQLDNEELIVTINVNHSVDNDDSAMEEEVSSDKTPEPGQIVSKPNFSVEIMKNGEKLGFNCAYVRLNEFGDSLNDDEGLNDVFLINEISIYKGDFTESTYAVSGEIMDSNLYDLLMNMLEERGISNEFAIKLSEFCTAYEHHQYIGLLQNLKSFVSK